MLSSNPPSHFSASDRGPHFGVVIVLLAAAFLGAVSSAAGGIALLNPVLLATAVTLLLSTGVLMGVAIAQATRTKTHMDDEEPSSPVHVEEPPGPTEVALEKDNSSVHPAPPPETAGPWRLSSPGGIRAVRVGTGGAGLLAILLLLVLGFPGSPPAPLLAVIATSLALAAAGLAATAAHYLAGIEAGQFPEAPGLCRGARVVAWTLVFAAVSIGFAWAGLHTIVQLFFLTVLIIDAAVCYGLRAARKPDDQILQSFPLELGVLSVLGSRANIVASILDAVERQLGIDLRSTWALTVVRRGLEPLAIGLCLLGWLSTSLTVVGVEEMGVVERLGVPVRGQPLTPGLHLHWPWPVDRVFRVPAQRVQSSMIGHEGEEEAGPENVLWAVEHAPNEYTLLLGDGRDLIAIDAAVQYRIVDPRAWRYHCQNPADALRAIAYRAVMRSTVNRTLSEALSENVVTLTCRMRAMVQQDADSLGLGVEVVAFTVGGMHPPVMVAADYEDVAAAEIRKATAAVSAQAFYNQTVPAAKASVLVSANTARAEGAEALARAAGEAWSFRALESQYRAAPGEYLFRRRLETLENGLGGKNFTVVDSRIQRDGGELWFMK